MNSRIPCMYSMLHFLQILVGLAVNGFWQTKQPDITGYGYMHFLHLYGSFRIESYRSDSKHLGQITHLGNLSSGNGKRFSSIQSILKTKPTEAR